MKLYREVDTNTGKPLSSLLGEMRLVEPIEITDEEIKGVLNNFGLVEPHKSNIATAITNLLKGER